MLEGLSPEARQIAEEVKTKMHAWIDENLDALEQETTGQVRVETQQLQAGLEELKREGDEWGRRVDTFLRDLEDLPRQVEAGDGQTLEEAIAKTRQLTQQVQAELKRREELLRRVGSTVTNVAITAATKTFGIPG